MINEITDGDYQPLEERELDLYCPCSKERFSAGLKSLGSDELTAILVEDKKASITCNFCNTTYEFSEAELQGLIDELDKDKKLA